MPMLIIRMRTRSPCLTIIGVVAGPDLPLKVSQLNSIESVFGTVLFGSSAHSCRTSAEVAIAVRLVRLSADA